MELPTDAPDIERRVREAFCARIAQLSLPEDRGIDRRDAMVLIDRGVLSPSSDREAHESAESGCPAFLEEARGYARGPLVFYADDAGDRCVSRARDLLLNERVEMRRGAIAHLKAVAHSSEAMSQYTRLAITQHGAAVLSETGWRRSAIELADALDDDWLLNLAGVHQAGPLEGEELWHEFVSAALRPSIAAVQRCSPGILCPGLHHDEIQARLTELIETEQPVDRLCDEYFGSFGHLPLGGEYGLGKVLRACDALHGVPDLAKQILDWAAQVGTPIARYHACEAMLSTETQLPSEHCDLVSTWFWQMIVPSTALELPAEEHAAWTLTEMLARYYAHYMEVRLPSDRGEPVSAMAWWMASRLVANWPTAHFSARSFGEQLDRGLGATVSGIWDLVCPPMQPCMLRWLTHFGPSPWAASILSAVTNESQMQCLMAGVGPGTTIERVAALTRVAVLAANLPLEPGAYRYSPDLRRSLCWAFAVEPDEAKRTQLTMLAEGIDWSPPDTLSQALEAMESRDPFMQSWLGHGVRQRLANAALDGDTIWALVSGTEWKSKTWLAIDPVVAQAVGLALVNDAARRRPEWAPQLPHLLAEVAEGRSGSEEERVAMFGLLLRACCALDAPSGLIRLMRGRSGRHYRTLAVAVKANVEQVLPHAGGWGAGRLRALLVDLL